MSDCNDDCACNKKSKEFNTVSSTYEEINESVQKYKELLLVEDDLKNKNAGVKGCDYVDDQCVVNKEIYNSDMETDDHCLLFENQQLSSQEVSLIYSDNDAESGFIDDARPNEKSTIFGEIRKFESGGVRDTDEGKLDLEGFLSPIVIEAFGEYMNKHRILPNKEVRDSDNWLNGFGDKHFDVCMKSLWRHFLDLWLEHRGFKSREGIEDAMNGIIFNVMAYYHRYLLERYKNE